MISQELVDQALAAESLPTFENAFECYRDHVAQGHEPARQCSLAELHEYHRILLAEHRGEISGNPEMTL